jgi:hypothetical protein
MQLHGTFVVSVQHEVSTPILCVTFFCFCALTATPHTQPTIVFDILLLWWAVAVFAHLYHAQDGDQAGAGVFMLRVLLLLSWVVTVLALLVSPDPGVYHLVLFIVLPAAFALVITLASIITSQSRPDPLSRWYAWNAVLGENAYEILVVCVGLPCALRLQLLFMGRNELAENWFALYLAVFTAHCSAVVRLLRHSAMSIASDDSKKTVRVLPPRPAPYYILCAEEKGCLFFSGRTTRASSRHQLRMRAQDSPCSSPPDGRGQSVCAWRCQCCCCIPCRHTRCWQPLYWRRARLCCASC